MSFKKFQFIITRLWRYNSLYFLKPHDCVNDTLTSSLLSRLDWSGEFAEIGGGDGVFSYIMHGGFFSFSYDRYLQTDLRLTDIYDTHVNQSINPRVSLSYPNITLSIDAKLSHVNKISEIRFAKHAICCNYESLPLPSNSIENIFFYTPHGMKNHSESILESARVLKPGGKMNILVFNNTVKDYFIIHKLSMHCNNSFKDWLLKLDNGRYDEISTMARSSSQWIHFFQDNDLEVESMVRGLSPIAWMFYDIQTRPILLPLISLFRVFPRSLRTIIKFFAATLVFPYIILFYLVFSNEDTVNDSNCCYIAFQLRKKS